MRVTLRRTNIDHAPAYEGRQDYTVYKDGQPVGRIYQPHTPASPEYQPHPPPPRELTWFWSITVPVYPKFGIQTHGHAATLARAKAAVEANLEFGGVA
jgi:hypothetical protein